ncbi:MAG TPA: hypothetical protein DCP69_11920 [Candidatus Omnitrophica bacterium]|nr:hypothetical protein [Candidatus Omnitrophota bacterium]
MSALNREAYQRIIEEDIGWLNTHPRTLERDHIVHVLRWSITELYPKSIFRTGSEPNDAELYPGLTR